MSQTTSTDPRLQSLQRNLRFYQDAVDIIQQTLIANNRDIYGLEGELIAQRSIISTLRLETNSSSTHCTQLSDAVSGLEFLLCEIAACHSDNSWLGFRHCDQRERVEEAQKAIHEMEEIIAKEGGH